MSVIKNPTEYDTKKATNIRIEKDLKDKLIAEALRRKEAGEEGVTITLIINELLRERYKEA